jgi:hypothetical protein
MNEFIDQNNFILEIRSNTFYNNSAESAAAIYSLFEDQELVLNDTSKISWLNISNNNFSSNYALTLGGAVFYTGLKPDINESNVYENNIAGFGFGTSTFSYPV